MKSKRILSSVLALVLTLSTIFSVNVFAEQNYGTYSDRETLRMENFYPNLKVYRKSVYEYNGKIVAEYYNYNTMSFGNSEYDVWRYCETYLINTGWKRNKSNCLDTGVLRKEYYTKNNYTIDIQHSKSGNEIIFLFCSDEYWSAMRDDEDNVTSNVYDTIFGGEEVIIDGKNQPETPENVKPNESDDETMLKQLRMTIGSTVGKLYGNDFVMDVAPQIINGRTMLPARYVTENLGGEIEWIGEHQIVAITKGSTTLLFRIGSDSATVLTTSDEYDDSLYDIVDSQAFQLNDIVANSEVINNNYSYDENMEFDYLDYKFITDDYYGYCETYSREVQLDSAPVLISGRTFMPVRVIATFLGADVMWNGTTQTVMIEPK